MDFVPRKKLYHGRPTWAKETDPIFLTFCCQQRRLNRLANNKTWSVILTATEEMCRKQTWAPRLLVVMPDHVHLIADISRFTGIDKAIRRFKAKTALTGGIEWQRDAFDHRIRNETAVRAKWHYVLMNPVRAGLCATPEDWPYAKTWPRNRSSQDDADAPRSPQGEPW